MSPQTLFILTVTLIYSVLQQLTSWILSWTQWSSKRLPQCLEMVEEAKSRLCDKQVGKINEKVENFMSPLKEAWDDTDGEIQTEF